MSKFIVYLIEANVLLAMFYLLYITVLRKETHFQFNRFFLLVIPVLALLFPLLRFDFNPSYDNVVERPVEEISKWRRSYFDALAAWEFESRSNDPSFREGLEKKTIIASYGWFDFLFLLAAVIYVTGVVVCVSRTAWSLRWIGKILSTHSPEERGGVKIIKLPHPTTPFSFLNYVFVYAPVADTSDFDQILTHERIHIREKHSVDLLFVQLAASLLWFNPVVWRLIKSLKTTHEYIADKKTIQSGYSVEEYQALLLRQLISNNSLELVHNFNLSFTKKRITMMTHKKSGWSGKIKLTVTIAAMILCSAIIMQCNSRLDETDAIETVARKSPLSAVDLPVLPRNGFRFNGEYRTDAIFTITGDVLSIGGKQAQIEDILHFQGEDIGRKDPVVMMIDKDQTMGFVRKVYMTLRKADHRKLLFVGQTTTGGSVELTLLLPPDPEKVTLPDISKVAQSHLLKIELGGDAGALNQQRVYDFVTSHYERGEAEKCIVSATMQDNDTYGNYLTNYFYIREGYNQFYQERSQKMFGKDFYETTEEEYKAVRENIPMNISIAEE
jgi:hypothetical protein